MLVSLVWRLLLALLSVAVTLYLIYVAIFVVIFLGVMFVEHVWPLLWGTIKVLAEIGAAAAFGFILFASVAWVVEKVFDRLGLKKDSDI
jgi:hypothetical protein